VASLIIIVAMFALLWLLLIRPQRARQQQQKQLLESVAVGDEILTVGGIYGIVEEVEDDEDLVVQVAEGVNVRVARRAVATVVKPDEDEELEEEEDSADVVDADGDRVQDESDVADGDTTGDTNGEATVKAEEDSVRDEAAAASPASDRS
jgi:preprotein translocase subunit YajC